MEWGEWVAILNTLIRIRLIEKMRVEQRLKRGDDWSIWGKSIPGRETASAKALR